MKNQEMRMEDPTEGSLRHDPMDFTAGALALQSVQKPLHAEEQARIFNSPHEVLPINSRHPSYHLPLSASFMFQ